MAVESKHFEHLVNDGVYKNHKINEGTPKTFTFPNIDAPLGIVKASCMDEKGKTYLSEAQGASLIFFDGKKGHENGVNLGSNVEKEFIEGESVAVIDSDGHHTWLFTYSRGQGVTGESLEPSVEARQLKPEIPNNQTTHRARLLLKQDLELARTSR